MNKVFLYVGCITLLLVALAILTRPTEADYNRYLEKQAGIICSGKSFTCTKKESGEKLELTETKVQNRVFFTVVEKTFRGEENTTIRAHAFGMFRTFFQASVKKAA